MGAGDPPTGPKDTAFGCQKLAAHRGYFGQGSSHSPGQEAEEPIQKLTCPPAGTCLRAHLLPGRQGAELSSLQEKTEGQCQLLPHHRVQTEGCTAPSAWEAPLSPRVGGEHLAGISSWLGSSSQHPLSKSIPTPATSSSTTHLRQGDSPWLAPTHSGVRFSVGCPTTQTTQALTWTLEFRPGQRPQVTELSDTTAISLPAFKLAAKVRAAPRERTKGHGEVPRLQSSRAPRACTEVTGVQSR